LKDRGGVPEEGENPVGEVPEREMKALEVGVGTGML